MKRVYKYGTGMTIPEGAVYLCTKVETETLVEPMEKEGEGVKRITKINRLVWHYFLVEVVDER